MRAFLARASGFTAFLLLLLLLLPAVYRIQRNRRGELWHRISASHTTVIMGDSEMQRIPSDAVGDSAFNYAAIAEHYYFTYLKLRNLLAYPDSRIRTVILGVSVHNFAPIYSRFFDPESVEGGASFERFLYYLPYESNDFIDIVSFHKLLLRKNLKLLHSDEDYGYYESTNSNPSEEVIQNVLSRHYRIPGTEVAYAQLVYLNDIIELCDREDVRLVMVSTPVHAQYRNGVDCKYYSILAYLINCHIDVEYQNFLHLDMDNRYMADGNHLNKEGGEMIGRMIADSLHVHARNPVYETMTANCIDTARP